MKYVFDRINLSADGAAAEKAAKILRDELFRRTGMFPKLTDSGDTECIEFRITDPGESEEYAVTQNGTHIIIEAHRFRGLMYGAGLFLRKCEISGNSAILLRNIFGTYKPVMKTRGHGICYTNMSNSYEAWDKNQLRQYITELMFFGINTVEASFSRKDKRTDLMKYSYEESLLNTSEICAEYDLDLTVWYALTKKITAEETVENMLSLFGSSPKITSLFLPGGDPGDMQAEDFAEMCREIKAGLKDRYPGLEIWPSAQAPHEYPDWGERFKKVMSENPDEFDGIIWGPNHAMPLSEMRRSINFRYSIHMYPDIGHNVRCETPVRFYDDDWHYAYASTLSREAVNPRPNDYRRYHAVTRHYLDGNTSYSEGVNDDINKAVWTSLDVDPDCSIREVLKDYSRLFFPGSDPDITADIIFGLEQNWSCDPAESSSVEYTYSLIRAMGDADLSLSENWRYLLLLFRGQCDKIVRDRRLFELDLIAEAKQEVFLGNMQKAKEILGTEFPAEYTEMREELFPMAEKLFSLIGLQLDVEHFGGLNWERGCVLDTIDMPVTDRTYLLKKITEHPDRQYMLDILNRNSVEPDEYYFSFAEHGFAVCGRQNGEFYIDFRGDMNKDASMPMCMLKNYDHFSFRTEISGLTGGDYILRITYKESCADGKGLLKITADGNTVYYGPRPGGTRDAEYEEKYLAPGYVSVVYDIDKAWIQNGCTVLEITEPEDGFVMNEFRLTKKQ